MSNVTIYLPDELHAKLRTHSVNVSAVCRAALERELHRLEVDQLTDVDGHEIAARLRASVGAPPSTWYEDLTEAGREAGAIWARGYATLDELRELETFAGDDTRSELTFGPGNSWGEALVSLRYQVTPGQGGTMGFDKRTPFSQGAVAGALAILDTARPFLDDITAPK